MTPIFFIKTKYTGNIYRMEDFMNVATGVLYQRPNQQMNVDMVFNDGPTILDTQIRVLPDATNIRDYTHITVPSKKKVYRIKSIDDLNFEASRLYLEDEPLIAEYFTLNTTPLLVTRTNDASLSLGVSDVARMASKTTLTEVKRHPTSVGKIALIHMQPNPTNVYKLKFSISPEILLNLCEGRVYANYAALYAVYPNVITSTPWTYEQFQKIAKAGSVYYQSVWYQSEQDQEFYLTWVELKFASTTMKDIEYTIDYAVNSRIDGTSIKTAVIAIPFSIWERRNVTAGKTTDLIYQFFDGPGAGTTILDVRIVDSSITGINYVIKESNDYYLNYDTRTTTASYGSFNYTGSGWATNHSQNGSFFSIRTIDDINMSHTVDFYSYSNIYPFKKWILDVFGKRIEIDPRFLSGLNVSLAFTPSSTNYSIWYDKKEQVIETGIIDTTAQYAVDKLDQFYTNNPTYKDQYQADQFKRAFQTVGGGAVGGFLKGGPIGAITGAGVGALTAGLDVTLQNHSEGLRQKGLRLQPDELMGSNTDISLALRRGFGIILYEETMTYNREKQAMFIEQEFRGYPVNKVITMNSLNYGSLAYFLRDVKALVIHGKTLTTIKNNYVTDSINKKLQEGIILVYEL